MEKRKSKLSKILFYFDEIVDENLNIKENLDRVINQTFSIVDHTEKDHDSLKPKEVSDVNKHCLEVLKKLTEINSVLENILDDNPLQELHVKDRIFSFENVTRNSQINEASYSSEFVTENVGLDANVEIVSSQDRISEISSQNSILPETGDTENEISIQLLRRSLQKLSKKVGLNDKHFSDMKDFYEKSHCLHTSSYQEESIHLSETSNTNLDIPEKDINTQDNFKPSCSYQFSDISSSEDNTLKESVNKSSSPLIMFSEESCEDTDIEVADVFTPFKDTVIVNQLNSPDFVPKIDTNKTGCTALEKLNNYKARVEDTDNFENLVSPDIKLKPSTIVLQKFVPQENGFKKKKKLKNEENIIFELKSKETPEPEQECVISHIESPSEFYIHVVDEDTMQIDKFSERMNKHFTENDRKFNGKSKEVALSEIGIFCVAYVEKDNGWYRGKIINKYLNEKHDQVCVQIVDYGNKIFISYKNLRRLTEWMIELPMLAIRCHFPLLYPPNSTHLHRLTKWPQETIEALLNLSGLFGVDNKTQFFKIVYSNKEQNSLALDLLSTEENPENTVGQILIDTGLAVQIISDYDENAVDLERYLEDVDNIEVENINEAAIGYDPRDEARICRFTKSDGTCFKGKNCKLEHTSLSKDGFTTDQEAVFTEAMYPLILPQLGASINLLITGYIDSCRFFAQIINNFQVVGNYMMDQEFYYLLEEMNSTRIIKTYESFKVAPAIGEIVIVSQWKKWSRGIVRDILMGDDAQTANAQIYLVDFGEYTLVPIKELRKIKPKFLKLPFQVVECYIHNYEMNKDCSVQKAKKFFYKNLYFRNFTAITMSSYPPLKLQVKNKNGLMDVGEILSNNGLAVKRLIDTNIIDNCWLDLC